MASDIKLKMLVDVELASGKISVDKLASQAVVRLEQMFSKLPSVKLKPRVEIEPKFAKQSAGAFAQNIKKDLEALLPVGADKVQKGKVTQFRVAVDEYLNIVRQFERIQASAATKFSKGTEGLVEKLLGGPSVQRFSALSKGQRESVRQYLAFLEDFGRIQEQLRRSLTNLNRQRRVGDGGGGFAAEPSPLFLDPFLSRVLQQAGEKKNALRAITSGRAETQFNRQIDQLRSKSTADRKATQAQAQRLDDEGARHEEQQARRRQAEIDAAFADRERQENKRTAIEKSIERNRRKVEAEGARDKAKQEREAFAKVEAERRAEERSRKRLEAQTARQAQKEVDTFFADAPRRTEAAVGRQALSDFGTRLPEHLVGPAITATREEIAALKDLRAANAGNAQEVDKANRAIHEQEKLLGKLTGAQRSSLTLTQQVGALLRQFARYAVGYGALFQVLAGVKDLITASIDLEDRLKQIQAITGSTNNQISRLGESIKRTAETTRFGLGDIASAVKIIAQADVDLKDIPKVTQSVANLATASGASLQVSADIITTVRDVYEGLDTDVISNQVIKAANESKLAVEDLQTTLNLQASFAESANITLPQLLGSTAILRNAGVKRSTIATGGSQLLLELFQPDKKLLGFLQQQYEKIGESLSPEQIFKRFAGFRYTDNPLFAALIELKRLGVDAAGSIEQLERTVDKRAVNVLLKLLERFDELPAATSKIAIGNDSFQAAATAMNSLKAATQNLGDSLEVLADSMESAYLPTLTRLVKSTSDAVQRLTDLNNATQRETGGQTGGGIALSGLFGIGSAVAGGGGLRRRLLRGLSISGLGSAATVEGVEGAAAAGASGGTASEVGTASAVAVSLIVSKLFDAAVDFIKRMFTGEALKATLARSLGGRGAAALVVRLGTALTGWVGVLVGALIFAGGAVVSELFKGADEKAKDAAIDQARKLKALGDARAQELARKETEAAQFETFRRSTPSSPASPESIAASVEEAERQYDQIQAIVNSIAKRPVAELDKVRQALEGLNTFGVRSGASRDREIGKLVEALQVSKSQLTEELVQQLQAVFLQAQSSITAFKDLLRSRRAQSISAEATGSITEEGKFTLQFDRAFANDPRYKRIIENRDATDDDVLGVMRAYLDAADKARLAILGSVDSVSSYISNVAASLQDSGTLSEGVALDLREQVSGAVESLGLAVADQIVAGIAAYERSNPQLAGNVYEGVRTGVDRLYNRSVTKLRNFDAKSATDLGVLYSRDFEEYLRSLPESDRRQLEAARAGALAQRQAVLPILNSGDRASVIRGADAFAVPTPNDKRLRQHLDLFSLRESNPDVDERFTRSAAHLGRLRQIDDLEHTLAQVRRDEPGSLGVDGDDNLLRRLTALKVANIEEELAFARKQRDNNDEVYRLEDERRKLLRQSNDDIEAARHEEKTRELRLRKATLELESRVKFKQEEEARDAGNLEGLSRLQDERMKIVIGINDLERQLADATKNSAEKAELEAAIREQNLIELTRIQQAEFRRDAVLRRAELVRRETDHQLRQPATGSAEDEAFALASGQVIPRAARIAKAAADLGHVRTAIAQLTNNLTDARVELERIEGALGRDNDQYARQVDRVRQLEDGYRDLQQTAGGLRADLHELNATFASEFAEVSLSQVAERVDDLDGSMSRLGENFTEGAANFASAWADAVSEFVVNGGNLKESMASLVADFAKQVAKMIVHAQALKVAAAVLRFLDRFGGSESPAKSGLSAFAGNLLPGATASKFAHGGIVSGLGNTDSVRALLTPGEGVLTRKAVRLIGSDTVFRLNAAASKAPVRFADGGVVGKLPAALGTVDNSHRSITANTTVNVDARGKANVSSDSDMGQRLAAVASAAVVAELERQHRPGGRLYRGAQ